jgi:hypothetical protein
MPKIRAKPKNKDERCAVCRDASSGLVMCRGCSTLLHAACLVSVNGCPTIGCDEADPLQREPEAPADPEPVGSIAKLMWEIEKSKNKRRMSEAEFAAEHSLKVHKAEMIARSHSTDWEDMRRAEEQQKVELFHTTRKAAEKKRIAQAKATRLVPECLHQFDKESYRCIFCNLSMGMYAGKELGEWRGPPTEAEGRRRHEIAKAEKARRKREQKHWIDQTFEFVIEYGGRLLHLAVIAIIIVIYLILEFGSAFV